MQLSTRIGHRIRTYLADIPFLSNYIFMDSDAIFRKLRNDGAVKYIRGLRPSERRRLHFGFGMEIRNAFLLWHPKNPYTMKRLEGLSDERQSGSPHHPDNYSWAIISRLIVAAELTNGSSDIDTSEHLVYSLLSRADDSEETLTGIKASMDLLVLNGQWELINEVFAEAIEYNPSPRKLAVMNTAVAGFESKLAPINYLRSAMRSIKSK